MILRFLSPSVPSPLFTHEIQTASTESSPVVLLPNKKQHVKASFSLSPLSFFSRCFAVTTSNSSAFPFTPIFKSLSSGIIFRSSHTGTNSQSDRLQCLLSAVLFQTDKNTSELLDRISVVPF